MGARATAVAAQSLRATHTRRLRPVAVRPAIRCAPRASAESAGVSPADWKHVMLFLLDANAQHLSSDSKSALTTAASLAMSSGKLTVVFLDDSGASSAEGEHERAEMKSALEALGLSDVAILEEKIEDKGKGSVAVGEAADTFSADLVVLSSSAVHEKHVDANLLAEFVPAPLLLLP